MTRQSSAKLPASPGEEGGANGDSAGPLGISGPFRIPLTSPRAFLSAALVLYSLAWLLSLLPFFLGGVLPGLWTYDTNLCFIPYRAYLLRSLSHFNFPDLAAGEFFGQPMMTCGQPMLLYPTLLAGWILPFSQAAFFQLDLWLHATLASLGCAWMLRRRGAGVAIALVLGWVYPNTTAFLFRAWGHWTMLHQAALLPWILAAWEAMDRMRSGGEGRPPRGFRAAAVLTAATAFALMCRTPHWPYLLAVALAPLEIGRAFRRRRLISLPRRAMICVAIAASALLLAAPDVIPPLLGLRDSFRSTAAQMDFSRQFTLSPFNLISMVSPYGLFSGRVDSFFGNWSPSESIAVAGRAVFLLGFCGLMVLFAKPKRLLGKGAMPLMLIAVGLLFGIAGDVTALRDAFGGLPLFSALRAWGRASLFIVLGLILLAALGFDRLKHWGKRARRVALGGALCGILLAACLLGIRARLGGSPEEAARFLLRLGWHVQRFQNNSEGLLNVLAAARDRLAVDAVWYALAATVLALLAFARRRPWRRVLVGLFLLTLVIEAARFQQFVWCPRSEPMTPETLPKLTRSLLDLKSAGGGDPLTVAFLPSELSNFALQLDGVRSLTGTDSNMRGDYGRWLNEVQDLPPWMSQLTARLNNFTPGLIEVAGLSAVIESHDPGTSETVGLADGLADLAPLPFAYRVVENANRRPYAQIVNPPPDDSSTPGSSILFGTPVREVRVMAWTGDAARLDVAATDSTLLRIREFPDPRWRVKVNGKPVAHEWKDHNLYVPVPPGGGSVTLDYVDAPARVSVAIAILAWIAFLTLLVHLRRSGASSLTSPR